MNAVENLDEIQYDLEINGVLVRKQIGRRIWEERGWATVAVAYQERSSKGDWKPARVALMRFRRADEMWTRHEVITMTAFQAFALAGAIHTWGHDLMPEGPPPGTGEGKHDDLAGNKENDDDAS
jgi:hypothetical protein